LKDIIVGINLFNDADFFSAHDYFESLWVESNQKDKLFFQGLVQISVGCYHLVSGNLKGALSQLSKGKIKLEKYTPSYKEIELESLLSEIKSLINKLKSYSSGSVFQIDPGRLPKLKRVK
jgi:predicted metal-dependent hydrolase